MIRLLNSFQNTNGDKEQQACREYLCRSYQLQSFISELVQKSGYSTSTYPQYLHCACTVKRRRFPMGMTPARLSSLQVEFPGQRTYTQCLWRTDSVEKLVDLDA